MKRLLMLAACLAAAGPAMAGDYDERPWRKVETGRGDLWIDAEDAENLDRGEGRPRGRLTVLSLRATGRAVYTVSEIAFTCDAGGSQALERGYGPRGELVSERDRPEVEVDPDSALGMLFQAACDGAPLRNDVELGSIREVMAYEASGATSPGDRGRPYSGYGGGWRDGEPGEELEEREPGPEDEEPWTEPDA